MMMLCGGKKQQSNIRIENVSTKPIFENVEFKIDDLGELINPSFHHHKEKVLTEEKKLFFTIILQTVSV